METISETSTVAGADGLGLGLVPQKVARTETLPFRMLHPVPSNVVGPTFCNGSECRSSDPYDVAGGGARTLQPFPSSAFEYLGTGMAASMRFPFTSSQWQELERQALIYKYMMASMPVPSDLLVPICSRTLSDASTAVNPHSSSGTNACFNLRFSSKIDPEPGRCRRTDGKKWRCSRDVAPDQKYCERHMHRGRPRSRKPVEPAQNQSLPTRIPPSNSDATATLSNLATTAAACPHHHQSPGYSPKRDSGLPSPALLPNALDKEPRFSGHIIAANPQWQLLHTDAGITFSGNVGRHAPVLQPFDEQLELNFTDFSSARSEAERNGQRCLYLNPYLKPLEDPDADQRHSPKGFIDAWSLTSRENPTSNTSRSAVCGGKNMNSSLLMDENLPVSSLTLSIPSSHGTAVDDFDQIEMGRGVNDSEGDNGGLKPQPSSWINSVPWLSSTTLGGPLGEVLQSSTAAGSNSAFFYASNSSKSSQEEGLSLMTDGWEDGANPFDRTSRLESSPSCVLHKTLVSPSESSTCSSPTFAASKTENALQWLCHGKLSS